MHGCGHWIKRGRKHWSAAFPPSFLTLFLPLPTPVKHAELQRPGPGEFSLLRSLGWAELPVCWAVVPCQKGGLSAASFIDALKWRLRPFLWANESSYRGDQVLYWTDLYFSKCEHQRVTHPHLLSVFAFRITCVLKSVCRNIIVCAGDTETESSIEFREETNKCKRQCSVYCCIFPWSMLLAGIPTTARLAFWNMSNSLRNRLISLNFSIFVFLKI